MRHRLIRVRVRSRAWAAFRIGLACGLVGVGSMFLGLAVTGGGYGGLTTYGTVAIVLWLVAAGLLRER